jgi:hypothetical protein
MSTEQKAARLQSAREELDELLTEQRNLPRELAGARKAESRTPRSPRSGVAGSVGSSSGSGLEAG